jgi:hypothetical protein
MPARAKPNAPARGAPKMESKPKVGKGQGYEKGGYVPGKEKDVLPVKRPPGRGKDLAPARRFKGKYEGYAEGGPVDEILPGDGRGGLEVAMPAPYTGKMYADEDPNYYRNVLSRMQAELEKTPPPLPPELMDRPTGDLRPLPEEPNYGGMTTNLRNPLVAKPQDYDPGLKNKKFLDSLLPQEPNYLVPLPQEPIYTDGPGKAIDFLDFYREQNANRVGNRRAMMGDRRDMAMRPGMRGVARRAAPARMRAPAPVRQPAMLPFELQPEPLVPVFKKGGAVKGEKIAKVMREYKEGKLHSGSKKGPVVKNPKQAMAIALSEARSVKKAKGGEIFSDEYMAYESKGPKTRYTAAKGRREARERAMERRALDKARHAEKYAPGLSLDMEDESTVPTYQSLKPRKKVEMLKYAKGGKAKHSDVKMDKAMVKKAVHKHEKAMHPGKPLTKLNRGGVPSYGRKAMYGGGKC